MKQSGWIQIYFYLLCVLQLFLSSVLPVSSSICSSSALRRGLLAWRIPPIFYSAAAQPRAPPDGLCLQARPRASAPDQGPCGGAAPPPSPPPTLTPPLLSFRQLVTHLPSVFRSSSFSHPRRKRTRLGSCDHGEAEAVIQV